MQSSWNFLDFGIPIAFLVRATNEFVLHFPFFFPLLAATFYALDKYVQETGDQEPEEEQEEADNTI